MPLHALDITIRWRDGDALGHVNHAVFLTYLEEVRDAFFGERLGPSPSYVVVRLELDLAHELRLDATRRVTAAVDAVEVGRTSITTSESLTAASGEVAARARVVSVWWDAEARAPQPLRADQRRRLAATAPGATRT